MYPSSISKLIYTRRKELKISQIALTKSLNWSSKTSQYLSNIELGKCSFPVKHVNQLSIALQLPRQKIIEALTEDFVNSIYKINDGSQVND